MIEDDPPIAAGLFRGLSAAGFAVELIHDGARGAEAALARAYDLIVLDLMLPERDGLEVLQRWRGRVSAPVIVLSARTALDDRLQAFAGGAVDYLAKPFWIEELIARIRAHLRWSDAGEARQLRFGDGCLDLDARTLTIAGEAIGLTPHELGVLAYLVERPGRAIARQTLADGALTGAGERSDRIVDTHVARIRKKIGAARAAWIATVWGIGYRFDPPEDG
ncbi:MAG: response regulator transcription factor [Nannocystaceae bacterium]